MKKIWVLLILLLMIVNVTAFSTNSDNYSVTATSLGQQGGEGSTPTYSARFQTTAFQETREPGNTENTSAEIGWFPDPTEAVVTPGDSGGGNILKYGRKEEWAFIIGDGICQYTLGENRFNSRHDCRPTIFDYGSCMFDQKRCFDDYMWREAIGLGVTLLLILYVLYRFRFLIIIDEDEEKKKRRKRQKSSRLSDKK